MAIDYKKPMRPYLFRCYYDWMVDNIPSKVFIEVDVNVPLLDVPKTALEHLNEAGRLILNIAPTAIKDLTYKDDFISFKTKFGGIIADLNIPLAAINSLYSQPLKVGITFPSEQYYEDWIEDHKLSITNPEILDENDDSEDLNLLVDDESANNQSLDKRPKRNSSLKIIE